MACCKVCCGCKECDEGEEGKCCCGTGSAAECCQAGEYCCTGKCESGPCCESDDDCPEGECCNGDVRPGPGGCGPCETCADDEDCFAYGREYCCGGVCQDEPCDPCQPCDDCSWPAEQNETGIACVVSPCCDFPLNLSNSRSQAFSSTLPSGISWKTGYPDALDLCNWRWCTDTVIGVCYDSDANTCRFITKTRYKLLALDCSTQSVVDLTDIAATGTFETTSPGACTDGPDFPAYFGDPVPDCPP